jgi:hypothetical protein
MNEQTYKRICETIFKSDDVRNTFIRQLYKYCERRDTSYAIENFRDASSIYTDPLEFPYLIQKLLPLAEKGFVTASDMLKSAIFCATGMDAVDSGDTKKATAALSEAYRKNSLVVKWDSRKLASAMRLLPSGYRNHDEIRR